jgi:hypothetical protein
MPHPFIPYAAAMLFILSIATVTFTLCAALGGT